jgi:hypothetical protein
MALLNRTQAVATPGDSREATPSTSLMPMVPAAGHLDGRDEAGFPAVATRSANGVNEVMLVKAADRPVWGPYDKVEFPADTP